jgi:hypothetical protein
MAGLLRPAVAAVRTYPAKREDISCGIAGGGSIQRLRTHESKNKTVLTQTGLLKRLEERLLARKELLRSCGQTAFYLF